MMTGQHVEASLKSRDGKGIVVMKSRYATDADDLWSAITEPDRLSRWYGKVQGELRLGGEFRLLVHGSQWEGRGRVDECDPPHRLRVTMAEEGGPEGVVTAELVPDGAHTILVIERFDVPLEHVFAYGAGWQVHVEDLGAYLSGHERDDWGAAWLERWDELADSYRRMPVAPLAD